MLDIDYCFKALTPSPAPSFQDLHNYVISIYSHPHVGEGRRQNKMLFPSPIYGRELAPDLPAPDPVPGIRGMPSEARQAPPPYALSGG